MDTQLKYDFKDFLVLVTGAAQGMGLAASKAFARNGATVVMSDLNLHILQSEADHINNAGGKAIAIRCDVSDSNQVNAMIDTAVQLYGKLDAAYNNAGINTVEIKTADLSQEEYQKIIAVNLNGTWNCLQAEIRQMQKQGFGSIVNCSSIGGMVAAKGRSAYSATKHAVVGLTRSAAIDYADAGIRINAICPGSINTPMVESVTGGDQKLLDEFTAAVPMGRLGKPEEIAEAVMWLASNGSSYVTGQTLIVDGGLLAL